MASILPARYGASADPGAVQNAGTGRHAGATYHYDLALPADQKRVREECQSWSVGATVPARPRAWIQGAVRHGSSAQCDDAHVIAYPMPRLRHLDDEDLLLRLAAAVFPGAVDRLQGEDGIHVSVKGERPTSDGALTAEALFRTALGALRL